MKLTDIKPNPGGVAQKEGVKPTDVDPKQLRRGMEVEKEHGPAGVKTTGGTALDHLAEHKRYYTGLDKMETELKSKEKEAYAAGFIDKCAQYNVDPVTLLRSLAA